MRAIGRYFIGLMALLFSLSAWATSQTCFEIVWEAGENGNFSAIQAGPDVSFMTINGSRVVFNTVSGSITEKELLNFNNVRITKTTFSISRGCISNSFLKLSSNAVTFGFQPILADWAESLEIELIGWVQADLSVVTGRGRVPLCRAEYAAYGRRGTDCKNARFDLDDIAPGVAGDITGLEAQINSLSPQVATLTSELSILRQRLDAIDKKVRELTGKSLDQITDADLDAIGDPVLTQLVADGRRSLGELQVALKESVAETKADIESTKEYLNQFMREHDIDVDEPAWADFEIPDLQIPDPVLPEVPDLPESDAGEGFRAQAEETLRALNDALFVRDAGRFVSTAMAWIRVNESFIPVLEQRALFVSGELEAYLAATKPVNEFIRRYLDEDFFFKDSTAYQKAPQLIRAIKTDIMPKEPELGKAYRDILNTWTGPQLTPEQERLVVAVYALAEGFKNVYSTVEEGAQKAADRLRSVGHQLVAVAKETAICIGKATAAGDGGDWYELVGGFDLCTGEKLSITERAVSGLGIVAGSGALWRRIFGGISELGAVLNRGDDILHSAGKIGVDLASAQTRFGEAAVGALADEKVVEAASKWGTSRNGMNQLLEHTVGKDASRLAGIERRAGLSEGSLAGALSKTPQEVGDAMKQMDNLATDVVKSGTPKVDGLKKTYWKPGAAKPSDGLAVIEYDGKLQSLMPMARKDFDAL